MARKYKRLLDQIERNTGVSRYIVLAIWSMESSYGEALKDPSRLHYVPRALATLAYADRRRAKFARGQLIGALKIAQRGDVSLNGLTGSWAGAMGHTQFIPTSYQAYAIDGDGDGKKDIWQNQIDIFASMANYLKKEGWNDDLTWGRQVKLPENFDTSLAIPKNTGSRKNWLKAWEKTEKTLSQWQTLGVRRTDGTNLPNVGIKAALIFPDGENGRAYLAYDNYKSLMHWNLSYYFVSSVGHLSDRIKFPPIH